MQNKNHWYDGWFYDTLIAPNQDRMFAEIKKIIKPNSRILDVGCGTGRFSFSLADNAESIIGIDLSKKNIESAYKKLKKHPNTKISFNHTTISDLLKNGPNFDYAVMTYVIHEVNPEERIDLLLQMSKIADKIIIGDYMVPVKKGFWNMLNEVVEYLAGSEHYRNYRHFNANNGLEGLAKKASLKIEHKINNKPTTSQILVLTK